MKTYQCVCGHMCVYARMSVFAHMHLSLCKKGRGEGVRREKDENVHDWISTICH